MNASIRGMRCQASGLLAIAMLSSLAEADSVYVNGTCGDDGWTGQSEVCAAPDGPKETIQAGINIASNGDEVVLADGSYTGSGNRNLSLQGKLLTVRSGGDPLKCTIDCQSAGSGFVLNDGEPPASTVKGITITNGLAEIGAGAYCDFASSITFRDCVFRGNVATGPGGAIYARNGSNVALVNCVLDQNAALAAAGAFVAYSTLDAVNCLITQNHASSDGGGLWPAFAPFSLTNTAVVNNTGSFDGVGLQLTAPGVVTNCTIAGNYDGPYGAMHVYDDVTFTNCVVWGNLAPEIGGSELATISYSDVEGGFVGLGNIEADPLFVQPGSGGMQLGFGSPCLNVGLTPALPPDEFDVDGDGDFTEPIPYDAAGNPRVVGAAVDMGAYEGEYKPLPPEAAAIGLAPGEIAFLIPAGGPFNPVNNSAAVVTNGSVFTADVALTDYVTPVHLLAGTYSELGSTMVMQTTLAAGTLHNRMFIAFTTGQLRGRDPLSLDLTSFNPATGNWRLAVEGNTLLSPGHDGPVGDRIAVEGTGLGWGLTSEVGDYGVFWDSSLQRGFVWANLDYAADFAFGTLLCYADCAPPNGDGVVDSTDVQALLLGWGHRAGGIFDIDLDTVVTGYDLALLLGAWGECDGGIAAMSAPQKFIAPNWGRVVSASQREVDLDGNGEIDGGDLSLMLAAWSGDQPAAVDVRSADLNADGRVNRADVDVLLGRD